MNRKITFSNCLFVAAIALLLTACDNKSKFHIEGNITEAKDSMLYLEHMSLDGPVAVDSVKLSEDGAFGFAQQGAEAPEFYRLRIAGSIINVSIDSTETVTFKASYPTMAAKYEVSGSDNCAKIKELSLLQQQLLSQAIAIEQNNSFGVELTRDSIEAVINQYKAYVMQNYIFKEPQKAYSYFALFQTIGNRLIFNPRESDMDIQTYGAVATAWDTYYPGALRGENLHNIAIEGRKILRQRRMRAMGPAIDPAVISTESIIDVPLLDNKNMKRSLKELKGKVVLLDFHAFSSKNSTQRIMMLRELYNKYHAQGFEIYQVSVDPDEHFWKTQTAALPWISVHDPDNLQSQYLTRYNVQSIPTFFLIDRNNALYKRDAQIKDIDNEIASLL